MNWNNLADIPDFFSSKEKKKKKNSLRYELYFFFFLINVLFFPETFKILEKAESV